MNGPSMSYSRRQILFGIVAISTATWVYLLAGAGTGMYPHNMAMWIPHSTGMMGMTAGLPDWSFGHILMMLTMWWLMMVAMMLPGAAPAILLFTGMMQRQWKTDLSASPAVARKAVNVATTLFTTGYLVMWGLFSVAAVFAQWLLERHGLLSAMMTPTSGHLGAGLLVAAGLWQLTPLKRACLAHCRSPLEFIALHWRPGNYGAFHIGALHGLYCLGCCWFLMVLLFYAGVMNLVWIVGLTLFVVAEKYLATGPVLAKISGWLLLGAGVWAWT